MIRISRTAFLFFVVAALFAGCDSGNGNNNVVEPPPPPAPLAWDQANWDEVVWQ